MIRPHLYVLFATYPLAASPCMSQVLRIGTPLDYQGDGFGKQSAALFPGTNGEGPRIAIGRNQAFPPGEIGPQGRVFLYDGATGTRLRTIASPHPVLDGNFGLRLAASTDTDGDGSSDLVVSAHLEGFADPPSSGGRGYLISGATGEAIFGYPPGRALITFSAHGVASVPDTDGDGIDDPAFTARDQATRGRVHVYSGRTSELIWLLEPAAGTVGFNFGSAVASSPDMDGDGRGEIIVAAEREYFAPGDTHQGVIYVFSGATGQPLHRVPLQLVWAVAAVPDVNNDHVPDFMGGTVFGGVPELPGVLGVVRVFSGATGEVLLTLTNPITQYGQSLIGNSIFGAPDLNHDGHGEILVGANTLPSPRHPPPQSVGAVFIFSGANGQLLRTIRPPNNLTQTSFGGSVTTLPDTNHDGVPELIIGAPGEQIPTLPLGAVYVYYSCPADCNADGLATSTDFFAFLNAFLTFSPEADINHTGTLDSQDFFDYLTAFFAGC